MTITAKFENGVFRPLEEVQLQEGTVVELRVPSESSRPKPHSIGDTPFAGMWKDREDIGDSVEYIERLRKQVHQR